MDPISLYRRPSLPPATLAAPFKARETAARRLARQVTRQMLGQTPLELPAGDRDAGRPTGPAGR